MEVNATREGANLFVAVDGRVDGTNAGEFQEALEGVIQQEDKLVVLDLGALSYVSSAGLRVVLLVAKELQRQSAKLSVCALSDTVKEVFTISGFDKIIPVHGTRQEAVESS